MLFLIALVVVASSNFQQQRNVYFLDVRDDIWFCWVVFGLVKQPNSPLGVVKCGRALIA